MSTPHVPLWERVSAVCAVTFGLTLLAQAALDRPPGRFTVAIAAIFVFEAVARRWVMLKREASGPRADR